MDDSTTDYDTRLTTQHAAALLDHHIAVATRIIRANVLVTDDELGYHVAAFRMLRRWLERRPAS